MKKQKLKTKQPSSAFTIVELLLVIVIIGILAAITIVSYTGITKRANEATLQADLANASKKIKMYHALYSVYPTMASDGNGGYCPTSPADTNYCIKPSSGSIFGYSLDGDPNIAYSLTITKGSTIYKVTKDTSPTLASATNCPTGFILVPGSPTYGTGNFCVMKYEAKADDNNDGVGDTNQTTGSNTWPANTYPISTSRKLVSTAAGYPVANISQTTAITAAQNYTKDCTSCHLISEAEWMTIAQNVLSVPSNWSSGTVGSGYIYSGHNDRTPGNALVAVADDNDGYNGTGQTTGSNQRRTLKLSNNNVIWDMAGNVLEWSASQVSSAIQPGAAGSTYSAWLEWLNVTIPGSLSVNVTPVGTGINGADSWTSSNGVGMLMSNPFDTNPRGFLRGGGWNGTGSAGVLSLYLSYAPSGASNNVGLRVAAPAF